MILLTFRVECFNQLLNVPPLPFADITARVRLTGAPALNISLEPHRLLPSDEVDKGVDTDSGKVTVEVELTRNISVESEAGTDARGGVGTF